MQILLSLCSDGLVIDITDVLQAWNQMGHVVGIKGVQLVPHRLNFLSVHLDLLLVIFELLVSLKK